MWIKDILPRCYITPIIITARESKILTNRCEELGIKHVYQGIRNKLEKLHSLVDDLSECSIYWRSILDLQCMEPIKEARGIVGCPADAAKKVLKIAILFQKKMVEMEL